MNKEDGRKTKKVNTSIKRKLKKEEKYWKDIINERREHRKNKMRLRDGENKEKDKGGVNE